MDALTKLGQALTAANALAPLIAVLIAEIKSGSPGKTDDEIMAEALAAALETKSITETDMGDQP